MAKKRNTSGKSNTRQGASQNTSDNVSKGFAKNLVEDVSNYLLDDNSWTQARNAINNSKSGDMGSIGNEPSNRFCIEIVDEQTGAPLTIIGTVHVKADVWVLFSTDDSNSEIGIFKEESCSYFKVANSDCLNFDRTNLITGVSKQNFECKFDIYWSDGANPDRYIALDVDTPSNNNPDSPTTDVPWVQDCVDEGGNTPDSPFYPVGCITCTNTNELNCELLRLEPLIQQPCLRVERGATGGLMPNGAYYVVIAYTVQEQRVTDYFTPSNIQPLFIHANTASSLDIFVDSIEEQRFDEFELVLVQFFNNQTVASKVGIYSTRQNKITLDYVDPTWVQISKNLISIRTSIADKSDAIFETGPYMLRVGPTDKFDFNYQPLANQIRAKWINVQYPETYYKDGGNKAGYLRDEVYAFFIRWIYNTGDKSVSYHIPGRPTFATDSAIISGSSIVNAEPEITAGIPLASIPNWQVNNTAVVTPGTYTGTTTDDGGNIIAEGYMGYWESTELYPDDKPEIWNASAHPWSQVTLPPYLGTNATQYDLCNDHIRHHRFPDNMTDLGGQQLTNHFLVDANGNKFIRIMGVVFENVKLPVDNDGVVISNIVGYEILRGSRVGQETILAKGMINNMCEFEIDGDNDSNTNLVTSRKGLYPNYPYNSLQEDYFISKEKTSYEPLSGSTGPFYNNAYAGFDPNDNFSRSVFTFHSPDTQFTDPYLSATELKIYGELNGTTEGAFDYPERHPKHKFVTDAAFFSSTLIGVGIATLAIQEKKGTVEYSPHYQNIGLILAGASNGAAVYDQGVIAQGFFQGYNAVTDLDNTVVNLFSSLAAAGVPGAQAVLDAATGVVSGLSDVIYQIPGGISGFTATELNQTPTSSIPNFLANLNKPILFYNYMVDGIDSTLRLIKAASKFQQHALQYNSHCFYDKFRAPQATNKRTVIEESRYLEPYLQDFTDEYRINNLFRSRCVTLETKRNLLDPLTIDNSRVTVGQAPMLDDQGNALSVNDKFKNPKTAFNRRASSHYVGLKQRARNQYGQIESIIQTPVSTCWTPIKNNKTAPLFNGDTYVGRYTEKNTMFFFYNWLYNQPDGAEYNYRINKMLPHTSFWMDSEEFDWSDFISSISTAFGNGGITGFFQNLVTPSDKNCFDRSSNASLQGFFIVKNAFMYLFNSGVRDFYVESSINVDLRDWGEQLFERHYDAFEYTDLQRLFSTEIIKSGNFFKYDFSLSVNKLFNNLVTWGTTHTRNYDPLISESCFVYRPNRVLYSLPQSLESRKDYWRIFLPLNYKDFRSRVTAIKPINLNGALILFENESPTQFLGTEQLNLQSGTKITIGDGALFNQPLQYLDNSDRPYEYGSCQNIRSVVSTPVGVFYISQNQGKIFAVAGKGIQEISLPGGLKWWFASYLPYKLTEQFPDFELIDNPVIGIACQAVYNNEDMLMYFCKKDYVLRDDIPYTLTYLRRNEFRVEQLGIIVELGDPNYFRDASWTMSYDPKLGQWISYHDWHPNLLIPGKNTFLSVLNNSIWVHNDVCNSYCNYYGVDYPFEIEFQTDTVQQVVTMRSLEYQLECFVYSDNCYDRFHVLDFNFDELTIYNSEQCSGLLRLNLLPKNNSTLMIQYPIINPNFIDVLFSKEENKYRVNQFWDITNDRGEFTATQQTPFLTEPNGYVRNLNPANLNYNKFQTERKKFRHYRHVILFRRTASGNVKMLFNIANVKNLYSPR
jgi:hypothetical protein